MKAFNYKIGVKTCEDEIGINSDVMTEVDNQNKKKKVAEFHMVQTLGSLSTGSQSLH